MSDNMSFGESSTNQENLTDEPNQNRNQMLIAGPSNNQSSPPIFKLTANHCVDFFEYLSLKDVHSFGLACKAMQIAAGEYFKRNYKGSTRITHDNGIYTVDSNENVKFEHIQTPGFNRFINKTSLMGCASLFGSFEYISIHSDQFDSMNAINFIDITLNDNEVNYL